MLLRVDKVLGGNSLSDPVPSHDPPLYACLATAAVQDGGDPGNGGGDGAPTQGGSQVIGGLPHAVVPPSPADANSANRSGEVLTVGRKNSVVTIEDKCVSRGHATISLLSNRPFDDDAAAEAATLLGGRAVMEYGVPSTLEEARACDTSPTGAICVVRDRGSKFGTFVSVDEGLLGDRPPNDGDRGDETGDETDDEGAAADRMNYVDLVEKQIRAVRLLSADDDGVRIKFIRLEPHQSAPLLQLSHSVGASPYVILLFGPQGSAVRLSLLPLRFTFSRVKRPELDTLLASLRYVGAEHSAQWDVERSTHLVAPDRTAAAKGIMAWACRRPVVTKGYIEALLGRRGPGDELPREEDYCPPGTWDRNLKWTTEPSAALRGYRVAVMADDDNGPLARSAGADVLPIYERAPDSRTEFETWWGAQARRALHDRLALVVVTSTARKCRRLHEWLKNDGGVRFTNAKNIAKAITGNNGEGQLLVDVKKATIEKIEGWDAGRAGRGSEKEDEEDENEKPVMKEMLERATVVAAAGAQKNETVETAEKMDFVDGNPLSPNHEDRREDELPEEIPASAREKECQEEEGPGGDEVEPGPEEQPGSKRRRRREHAKGAWAEERDRSQEGEPAREDEAPSEKGAMASEESPRRSNESSLRRENIRRNDASSDDELGLPAERIPLPTAGDGWLVAAPRKRRAYRKEIPDVDGDVPAAAAETERVVGLIVREYVPASRGAGGGGRNAGRAGNNGKKKDFKRFRKNPVLRGYTSFCPDGPQDNSLPAIRLVERMPKESERQRQLQQQQADLEREQELADALFNEAGPRSGRRGGGTMRSFLSQSTTKRRRGRH